MNRRKNTISFFTENMLNRRKVFKTLFSLVGVNLIIAGLSFITTMLIANTLGKEKFGDFAFAVAVGTYGLMFVQFGLEKSLLRELVHFPDQFGELLKASLLLKSLLLMFFLVCFALGFYLFQDRSGFTWEMALVVLATVFTAFQLGSVFDAWQEMQRHVIYHLVERCIYFALIWSVILIPFLSLSVGLVGAFMMIAVIFGLMIQYHWAWPQIDFKIGQGTGPSMKYILRSNFFIWLAVLSGLSIDYMTQIILKLHAGSAELGVYSVAWKITHFSVLFLAQAARIGGEATARYTKPNTAASIQLAFLLKYVGLMGVLGLFIGLPCLLFPGYILQLFRPEFARAAEVLRLFGLYPILFGVYLALLQYVVSSRMQKTYFVLLTVAGLISIGLSLWLIPQMQGKGAAISVIVSLALALVLFASAVGLHLKDCWVRLQR